MCTLVLQKLVLCVLFFAQVLGELWAADRSKGHNLRLMDEAGSRAPATPRTRKLGQSARLCPDAASQYKKILRDFSVNNFLSGVATSVPPSQID